MPIRTLLAETNFAVTKTSMICDAFDAAWAELQRTDEALADPSRSAITRTLLAKRIIEMAHREDMNATQLRDDAIAYVRNNPTGSR